MDQMFFSIAFVFLFGQTIQFANAECKVPPKFWCDNPEVARQCHVEEQCKSLKQATSNVPVNFTLYYESLCPDCTGFFHDQLNPAFLQVGSIMNLHLVPYGNARETYDSSTSQWLFQCQHGDKECLGNLIETCAINLLKNATVYFPLIACMEHYSPSTGPKQAAVYCGNLKKINIKPILDCSTSAKGNHLEHEMALKTDALRPSHTYVPWVTLNGIHTDEIQNEAGKNLVGLICGAYTGSSKPAACKQ